MLINVTYQLRLAINISKRIIIVGARWSLELHVTDVVACFDDDPSMQVDLETSPFLAWAASASASSTYIPLCSGSS
jgi:hypothetical protein